MAIAELIDYQPSCSMLNRQSWGQTQERQGLQCTGKCLPVTNFHQQLRCKEKEKSCAVHVRDLSQDHHRPKTPYKVASITV